MVLRLYDFTKTFLLLCLILCYSCDSEIEDGVMTSDLSKDAEMVTDFGTIILRLSNETPLHRNNFIKLVNNKYYDSIAFHRVIENFMIQAGNPTTRPGEKYSGSGDPEIGYTIEAEIRANLFHKRGALGAARIPGDANPHRNSSGLQFYIVQRGAYVDSILDIDLERLNKNIAHNNVINDPRHKEVFNNYMELIKKLRPLEEEEVSPEDMALYKNLKHQLDSLDKAELESMDKYNYPEAHRDIYKTAGGAAHLDQNFTVFGEVVQGMQVVDSIAKVETGKAAKPINDIRIISARMIKRKSYK